MRLPLLGLGWLLASLVGCTEPEPGLPQGAGSPLPQRELQRSLGGEPATLDPQLAGDAYAQEVLRDFHEGLVTETADGRRVPGQAARWEISADGLEYRFVLRSGLRWSDGTPVVAGDFVAALRRAVDPATASPNAALLAPIAGAAAVMAGERPPAHLGVAAPRADLVVVRLRSRTDFLPALLAHPVAFPRGPAAGGLAYNGAYRPVTRLGAGPLQAIANEHYRAAREVAIRRIRYLTLADEQMELLRFRAGEIDVTGGLPTDQVAWARRHLPRELQLAPQFSSFFLGLNLKSGALRRDARLREALSLAIDRQWIAERLLASGQQPADRLVPPGLLPGGEAVLPGFDGSAAERLSRARSLYAAAGYSAARPLRLRLLYNRNTTVRRVVMAVAAMWRTGLGVEVELLDEEFGSFLAARGQPAGWDVIRLGWNADYADGASFLEVFRSGGADNNIGYASAAFDGWLDAAARSSGAARRSSLLKAEAELLAAHAIIPVYFLATRRLVHQDVVVPPPNPLNHNYTRHWRWAERER